MSRDKGNGRTTCWEGGWTELKAEEGGGVARHVQTMTINQFLLTCSANITSLIRGLIHTLPCVLKLCCEGWYCNKFRILVQYDRAAKAFDVWRKLVSIITFNIIRFWRS